MEQRNLILAIALSVAIIVGWQLVFQPSAEQRAQQQREQQARDQRQQQAPGVPSPAGVPTPPGAPGAPSAGGTPSPAAPAMDRAQALRLTDRVRVTTPQIDGSISLTGARIDDVSLRKHRAKVDPASPPVVVLAPERGPDTYFVRFGWQAPAGVAVKAPTPDTVWTADRASIGPGDTVTLSWDNGEGLVFRQRITVDAEFLFTVAQSIENKTAAPVSLHPTGLVVRHGEPKTEGIYLLHEGPYGAFDGKLQEFSWSDFKDGKTKTVPTTGGWVGFTDKYWMATLVPDQKMPVKTEILMNPDGGVKKYIAYFISTSALTVAPGATLESESRLYAGAKIVNVINDYTDRYGIAKFDLTIDWGWFWFFTKPLFLVLDWLFRQIGNFGLAILALTVLVKLLFFPLANKSYESMTKMKKLQPEMEKLRARLGDDKVKMNQELMALYKKEKVNPAAGCLPVLLQIPVFFALYKVLYTTIEMRHQPFYGWIKDLAAPDPLTLLQGFGLFAWNVPELLQIFDIGIWPIIMGVTMYFQQMLNPQPADPMQARIFQFLPIMFTFMLAPFAAGLVIYWAWNNLLSMAQQYVIMRKLGVPVEFGAKAPAPAGSTTAKTDKK
ncbi:MAG: membrane protein insertase YidC [Rhodospirillales bacterium]|nr:MAG: membrane protein insertase YidC [Rhodospirillales bacterium]